MRHFLFACLLILLCAPAYARSDVTILGLTTGMKISDIAAKLGSTFVMNDTTSLQRGQVVNFARDQEDVNVLAMGTKVVYIEHQQFFSSDGLLSADELSKALVAKYGPLSFHDDDTQSDVWIVIDGKTITGGALTPQLRACAGYESEGPFFRQTPENANFAMTFPKVPVKPQFAECGLVIEARPTSVPENRGLVSHLIVSLFDVKAAQDWYNAAQMDYNKHLQDAVDAARKNKPNL